MKYRVEYQYLNEGWLPYVAEDETEQCTFETTDIFGYTEIFDEVRDFDQRQGKISYRVLTDKNQVAKVFAGNYLQEKVREKTHYGTEIEGEIYFVDRIYYNSYNEYSNTVLNGMVSEVLAEIGNDYCYDLNQAFRLAKMEYLAVYPNDDYKTWHSFPTRRIEFHQSVVDMFQDIEWISSAIHPARAIVVAFLVKRGVLPVEISRVRKGTHILPVVDWENRREAMDVNYLEWDKEATIPTIDS